jgi:hypothetical protein
MKPDTGKLDGNEPVMNACTPVVPSKIHNLSKIKSNDHFQNFSGPSEWGENCGLNVG